MATENSLFLCIFLASCQKLKDEKLVKEKCWLHFARCSGKNASLCTKRDQKRYQKVCHNHIIEDFPFSQSAFLAIWMKNELKIEHKLRKIGKKLSTKNHCISQRMTIFDCIWLHLAVFDYSWLHINSFNFSIFAIFRALFSIYFSIWRQFFCLCFFR